MVTERPVANYKTSSLRFPFFPQARCPPLARARRSCPSRRCSLRCFYTVRNEVLRSSCPSRRLCSRTAVHYQHPVRSNGSQPVATVSYLPFVAATVLSSVSPLSSLSAVELVSCSPFSYHSIQLTELARPLLPFVCRSPLDIRHAFANMYTVSTPLMPTALLSRPTTVSLRRPSPGLPT